MLGGKQKPIEVLPSRTCYQPQISRWRYTGFSDESFPELENVSSDRNLILLGIDSNPPTWSKSVER